MPTPIRPRFNEALKKELELLAHFSGQGINSGAPEQDEAMKIIDLFKTLRLSPRVSAGFLILRFLAGLAFVFHGYGKIKNPVGWMPSDSGVPGILQAPAATAEFGGGLAWMLGLLAPLASFGLACTMDYRWERQTKERPI